MQTARQIVLDTLVRVERDGAYSGLALKEALSRESLSRQDAAFASMLFYGVIERSITLDSVIKTHSKLPPERMDAPVRSVLRMGLYQLMFMDSVPDSAAVNESVELCKRVGKVSASGMVNAVLRAFIRADKQIRLIGPPENAARMSVEFSCPPELVSLLSRRFGGAQARDILAQSIGPAPLYARVNTLKTTMGELIDSLTAEGVEATAHEAIPDCISLSNTGDITALKTFAEGLFHIQDASSQLCALALDAKPDMMVLDLCAAPGGKSFTIAQTMQNKGRLLSFDLYDFKTKLIEEGARRLGLTVVKAQVGDAGAYNKTLPGADRVLCDAPCSGYGVMRRKPEIKYKPPGSFTDLEHLQRRLLKNAACYVNDGGLLLYSTCTLRREENEQVARKFLNENPGFSPRPLPEVFSRCVKEAENMATILPGDFDSDGFFVAAFCKTGAAR